MKPLSRQIEARIVGIHAKKTAGLDRVRQLLHTLPPELHTKLNQTELKTGIAIMNKTKVPQKAVIQSLGDGMYCWNGSNALTGPEILERITQTGDHVGRISGPKPCAPSSGMLSSVIGSCRCFTIRVRRFPELCCCCAPLSPSFCPDRTRR
jgi:hypothetical protein